MANYGIETRYTFGDGQMIVEYRICDYSGSSIDAPVVWSRQKTNADDESDPFPDDVKAEYERLCGRGEFINWDEPPAMPNVIEMVADEDECAWDQPCAFGHAVKGHAVYCHNDRWLYAPRKCRRGDWCADLYGIDREKNKHQNCRGFKPNPLLILTS